MTRRHRRVTPTSTKRDGSLLVVWPPAKPDPDDRSYEDQADDRLAQPAKTRRRPATGSPTPHPPRPPAPGHRSGDSWPCESQQSRASRPPTCPRVARAATLRSSARSNARTAAKSDGFGTGSAQRSAPAPAFDDNHRRRHDHRFRQLLRLTGTSAAKSLRREPGALWTSEHRGGSEPLSRFQSQKAVPQDGIAEPCQVLQFRRGSRRVGLEW